MKFRSDMNGHITGRALLQGGDQHRYARRAPVVVDGHLAGHGHFAGETASGWQSVNFATPVAVTAGTTYVVSYHTNTGNYSADQTVFASPGRSGAAARACPARTSGGNGVYMYGPGAFPINSFNATNYYVDVIMATP